MALTKEQGTAALGGLFKGIAAGYLGQKELEKEAEDKDKEERQRKDYEEWVKRWLNESPAPKKTLSQALSPVVSPDTFRITAQNFLEQKQSPLGGRTINATQPMQPTQPTQSFAPYEKENLFDYLKK